MPINSLYPGYLQILYQSAYGAHRMIIPMRAWDASAGTSGYGGYTAWDGTTEVDFKDMVDALVAQMKLMVTSAVQFSQATPYTIASVGAPAIPQVPYAVGVSGTGTMTDWSKATQRTYSFRTVGGGRFKWVFLDTPVSAFNKVYTGLSAPEAALSVMFRSEAGAFSGRDGTRPQTFISLALTLNGKLRREYGMK